MATASPCPRCQQRMEIPQPAPEQIRCAKCGAVMRIKAAPVGAITAKPPSAAPIPSAPVRKSPVGTLIVAGLVGGVLLLCVLPAAILALTWSLRSPTKTDSEPTPIAQSIDEPPPPLSEVALKAKQPPPLPPRTREALDRASAHLKKRLLEPGSPLSTDKRYPADTPVGASALAGLALLEANVPPDDPAIQKALETVRAAGPKLRMVYAQGAVVFFLNRLHDAGALAPADRQLLRSIALRLIANQQKDGYWSYLNPPLTPQVEQDLLITLRDNTYKPHGVRLANPSHSMTQFALLSLWISARHDVPVRPALLAAADHFRQTQHTDGTWGYGVNKGNKQRCDSNTCAGLMALAMGQTLQDEKPVRAAIPSEAEKAANEQRDKAFAHLTKVIGRTKSDPSAKKAPGKIIRADAYGDYYFLWCLERVAVIYDLKTIGGKDWYDWGSNVILDHQRPNGSWSGDTHGDVCDTCFAILFLTRANLAKDLTEKIRFRAGLEIVP